MITPMRRWLVCLTVAGAACVSNLPEQDLRILAAQPSAKLSASDLWKDFQTDAAAATKKYFGKAIDVSDKPTAIETAASKGQHFFFGQAAEPRRPRAVAGREGCGDSEGGEGGGALDAEVLLSGDGRPGRAAEELHTALKIHFTIHISQFTFRRGTRSGSLPIDAFEGCLLHLDASLVVWIAFHCSLDQK